MPRVQNGGAGGGLATPVSVANGGTGTANGLTFYTPFTNNIGSAAGFGIAVNQTVADGVFIPYPLSVGNITVNITTIDAVNLYDFGFYNAAGTLVAHTGAIHLPSNQYQTFPFTGGIWAPTAGLYFLAVTGNSATAALGFQGTNCFVWGSSVSAGVTAGGVLGASITPLTKAVVGNANLFEFALS